MRKMMLEMAEKYFGKSISFRIKLSREGFSGKIRNMGFWGRIFGFFVNTMGQGEPLKYILGERV